MSDLEALARRIDPRYIEQLPGTAKRPPVSYVAHHIIEQFLIMRLGQIPQTTITRELYDGPNLTGVWLRMTVEVDGRTVSVEAPGEADGNTASTNGGRAKEAESDAYKRAAMRLGVGLHLWAQEHYFLDRALAEREGGEPTTTDSAAKPTVAGNGAPGPVAASEQSPPSQNVEAAGSAGKRGVSESERTASTNTSPSPKADGEAAQDSGEPPQAGPPPTLLPTEQDGAGTGGEDSLGLKPPFPITITKIWTTAKASGAREEDVYALAGTDSLRSLTERKALALVEDIRSWKKR